MTKSEGAGTFERIAGEVGRLVEEKNEAYGDSFAKCDRYLELLWPNGVPREAYGEMLAAVRIFDKLMRLATRKDYAGESPYRDIAGYGVLGAAKDEREAQLKAQGATMQDPALSEEAATRLLMGLQDGMRKTL